MVEAVRRSVLDRLVADALAHNTDVRTAANLQQARAALSEARGARLPGTTASAGYTRQRIGAGALAEAGRPHRRWRGQWPTHYDFDFYQLGFDASWGGSVRPGVRSIRRRAAMPRRRRPISTRRVSPSRPRRRAPMPRPARPPSKRR